MLKNKNKTKIIEMSESYIVAVMLTITGGYLDSYTYITRDGVFANAQTGNIVLFGINLANGLYKTAFRYSIPLISFVIGVLISDFFKTHAEKKLNLHWRQFSILLEIIVLLAVGFLTDPSTNILATILVSFVCSLQVESFRKVHGHPFASTMCTGNLRSGSNNLYKYISTQDKFYLHASLKYLGIIIFFIFGAYIGVKLTTLLFYKSVLLCIIPLIIAFLLMFKDTIELL